MFDTSFLYQITSFMYFMSANCILFIYDLYQIHL